MNSDLDQQSNTALIHQSLEEIHILLSAMEIQTKLGMSHTQPEMDIEREISEDQLPMVEDDSLWIDEF